MTLVSGIYLSSTSNIDDRYNNTVGQMESIGHIHHSRLEKGVFWGLDNGVFTNKFNEKKWLRQLEKLLPYKDTCLFIAIPDIVGDFHGTLKRFFHYKDIVKDYPIGFVSQDGVKIEEVPWDNFDCIFIGGTDNHKLGTEAELVIKEAKKRNKWVHIGRVNSVRRILKFWEADSWDGTSLGFEPSKVIRFNKAVLQVREMKEKMDVHHSVFDSNSIS